MGLKHRAMHGLLANPDVAPFEVVTKPSERQDWILVDHLTVIHRVRESDYTESEPGVSVASMARTLASWYVRERAHGLSVVLVKDGPGVLKPSVREARAGRALPPHVEFCKAHLPRIEYAAMKLLADAGMKDNLFLVTRAKAPELEPPLGGEGSPARGGRGNLVSFHRRYEEYRDDEASLLSNRDVLGVADLELSDVDPSYCDGETYRPEGEPGVFVCTFADPDAVRLRALLEACGECGESEADTLMVELANALQGSATVCTGDSDLIATIAASGREGLTLRLDNRSYRTDRAMHDSPFGELLSAPARGRGRDSSAPGAPRSERDWFRALCDVEDGEESLLPEEVADRHRDLEAVLKRHGGQAFERSVYEYLHRGGIRGSVYAAFLDLFFESDAQSRLSELARELPRPEYAPRYVFESLCRASEPGLDSDAVRAGENERKRPREPEDLGSADEGESDAETSAGARKRKKKTTTTALTSGLKRTAEAYARGAIPRSSHARYLRLARSGRHLFLRVKPEVLGDESVRLERVLFMALCGTDYSETPAGLGIKRLLTSAVANRQKFSSWCKDLGKSLWPEAGEELEGAWRTGLFYEMGSRLAKLTRVPGRTFSKRWTGRRFELMCSTLKYTCDLWALKRPRFCPEYGFYLRNGAARFVSETLDAAS